VHADTGHLLWNALGLAILGGLIEWRSRSMLLAALAAGIVAVGTLLLTPASPLEYYCGLSGVLNSLLAVALWMEWRATRSWLVIAVACGSLGKVVIEVSTGVSIVSDISWPPWAWSHAAGLVGGLIAVLLTERPGWVAPVSGFRLNGPCGLLGISSHSKTGAPHPGLSAPTLAPAWRLWVGVLVYRGIWQPRAGIRPRRFSGKKIEDRWGRKPLRTGLERRRLDRGKPAGPAKKAPINQNTNPKPVRRHQPFMYYWATTSRNQGHTQ
jgi:hypothetical protein